MIPRWIEVRSPDGVNWLVIANGETIDKFATKQDACEFAERYAALNTKGNTHMKERNIKRAEYARPALQAFSKSAGYGTAEDTDIIIADLICDLLHLAKLEKFNSLEVAKHAIGMYIADTYRGGTSCTVDMTVEQAQALLSQLDEAVALMTAKPVKDAR